MGKPEVEEQEDVFQAILLADNFGLSIFGSDWADKQNPGANSFSDDEDLDKKDGADDISSSLTQEVKDHRDNFNFNFLVGKSV